MARERTPRTLHADALDDPAPAAILKSVTAAQVGAGERRDLSLVHDVDRVQMQGIDAQRVDAHRGGQFERVGFLDGLVGLADDFDGELVRARVADREAPRERLERITQRALLERDHLRLRTEHKTIERNAIVDRSRHAFDTQLSVQTLLGFADDAL